MGTAGDPSSSLGACGCTVEQSGWVWTKLHSPRLQPLSPRLVPALRCGPGGSFPTVLRQDYQFLDWQKAWLRALALEVTQVRNFSEGGICCRL